MNPYGQVDVAPVINAAGKLTALGGSAQSVAVAQAQASAARAHVDLAALRLAAGKRIAAATGAEAACVTSGAAAGLAISVAAVLTGKDLQRVRRLPEVEGPNEVLLQAGHDVDFGARVSQMIRLAGGRPVVFGSQDAVTETDLTEALSERGVAILFVKSHHCLQNGRLPLEAMVGRGIPVLVDAAAEADLGTYIAAGADLVTYSGGKAIGGPTCGFIAGRAPLIEACELQERGIARTMKVGKEQIAGLLTALDEVADSNAVSAVLDALHSGLAESASVRIVPDRAGREIRRVALELPLGQLRDLVAFLRDGRPSIRTRNHQLGEGYVLFDPREMRLDQVPAVIARVRAFFASQSIASRQRRA